MNLQTLIMASWNINKFLENVVKVLKSWGGWIIILIGVVMIIWSIYKLATGLLSQGRQDTNWFKIAIAFLIGGAFVAAGTTAMGAWNFVQNIAAGGQQTITDLGNGTTASILPLWSVFR